MPLKTELHTVTVLHVEVPAHISASEFENAIWACVPDHLQASLRDGITVNAGTLNEVLQEPEQSEDWPDAVKEFLTAVDWYVIPDTGGQCPDEFFFHR